MNLEKRMKITAFDRSNFIESEEYIDKQVFFTDMKLESEKDFTIQFFVDYCNVGILKHVQFGGGLQFVDDETGDKYNYILAIDIV